MKGTAQINDFLLQFRGGKTNVKCWALCLIDCVHFCVYTLIHLCVQSLSDLPVWDFSEVNHGGTLESLEIKSNSDTQQSSGWICATPFHVPHSGFIKYWLHWKPLLRVKGPQNKEPVFLSAFNGNLALQTFHLWCYHANPNYSPTYRDDLICIPTHVI